MKIRHTGTGTGTRTSPIGRRQNETAARDEVVDWLKDAYAMERGMESSLEKHSRNNELSAEVRDRAMRHAAETSRHAEEIATLLRNLGSETSAIKTGIGAVTQTAKGIGSMFARDERIKDLLDAYSMEHFEIACYTALAAAAEKVGMSEVVQVCNNIIPDEHRMAQAIIQSLPQEVKMYLFDAETAQR